MSDDGFVKSETSGLHLPAALARTHESMTADDRRLLSRALGMMKRTHGIEVLRFVCNQKACATKPMTQVRIDTPEFHGVELGCEHRTLRLPDPPAAPVKIVKAKHGLVGVTGGKA